MVVVALNMGAGFFMAKNAVGMLLWFALQALVQTAVQRWRPMALQTLPDDFHVVLFNLRNVEMPWKVLWVRLHAAGLLPVVADHWLNMKLPSFVCSAFLLRQLASAQLSADQPICCVILPDHKLLLTYC